MEFNEKIDLNQLTDVKSAYYVTEMDRLEFQGQILEEVFMPRKVFVQEFQKLNGEYPKFDWHKVKLSELFDQASTGEKNLIVISSRANAFKGAIVDKYPNSVIVSQVFDKKQI